MTTPLTYDDAEFHFRHPQVFPPGLSEIPTPNGSQEVMSQMKEYPFYYILVQDDSQINTNHLKVWPITSWDPSSAWISDTGDALLVTICVAINPNLTIAELILWLLAHGLLDLVIIYMKL